MLRSELLRLTHMNVPRNVLFLCTGNSARSILAEALANDPSVAGGWLKGHSAGSHPRGQVHPLALDTLRERGHQTDGLRSKSWDEFAGPAAPQMDFIFTVCDHAAAEPCPFWPGHPIAEHWGMPDPAAVEGTDEDRRRAFRETYDALRRRMTGFMTLVSQSGHG